LINATFITFICINGLVIIYQFSYSVFGFETDFQIGDFNNFVMNLVCFETYINFTHLVCDFFFFFSFSFFVQLTLFKIAVSYLLLCSTCFLVSLSFSFSVLCMGYVDSQISNSYQFVFWAGDTNHFE